MSSLALSTIGLSIALQIAAAVQALRLIRVTGWRAAWSMFAVALVLMAGRRSVSLVHSVVNGRPIDLMPEVMALAISVLMLVGVLRISVMLRAWKVAQQRDDILRRAQSAFITAAGPDHADAFRILAADLAWHCGWDGVVVGVTDGAAEPRVLGFGGSVLSAVEAGELLAAAAEVVRCDAMPGQSDPVDVCFGDRDAVAFPVVSGAEVVGVMAFVRGRGGRRDCGIKGMEAVLLAVGGMIGGLRFQNQRDQADHARQRLIAELERSNRELEQFAYISSHDMQEPLRMIVLYLELLQRRYGDRLDDTAGEYVGFAVEGARRMHTMILDLLQFCRLGRDIEDRLPQADAQAALDDAAHQLAAAHFSLTVASPLPKVVMAQRELERVFLNLLGNAVKFRAPDRPPEISVAADREGEWWHFRVADNGIGIESTYFEKIFQVFQRLHPRSEYDGTGIGLAFVKKAVEGRGGKVWVDSVPGQGSVFHFTLAAA